MDDSGLPYGEDVGNYWKTSEKAPDTWLDEAQELIKNIGGEILSFGFGSEPTTGKEAYMLTFHIEEHSYRIVWPVLPSKSTSKVAARRQAATFIYHDVKAKVSSAKVLGTRAAFFSYMMLPDGRTTTQATVEELTQGVPTIHLLGE
jgi:hypothetical protein